MKRSYIGLALGALVTFAAVLSLPSCGHDQKLVSLSIQPQTFTFLAPAGTEQYSVIGTFIHPPATKDLTGQATWAVDDGVVQISSGLVTADPLFGCGGRTISATVPAGTGGSSNIVTAYATVTVDDPNNPLCPGGGKLATLNVGIQGPGTVTSSRAESVARERVARRLTLAHRSCLLQMARSRAGRTVPQELAIVAQSRFPRGAPQLLQYSSRRTARIYSSTSNFPSVGLCFSGFAFFARTS